MASPNTISKMFSGKKSGVSLPESVTKHIFTADLVLSQNGTQRWMYRVQVFASSVGRLLGGKSTEEIGHTCLTIDPSTSNAMPEGAKTMTLLDISLVGLPIEEVLALGYSEKADFDVRDGSFVCREPDDTVRN